MHWECLISPIFKVQKSNKGKVMKRNCSQNLQFWLRIGPKSLIVGGSRSAGSILMGILEKLAGGGSVAVAVGISHM